jgi:hypothetical protein
MAGPDFETDGGSEFVPSLEKNVREQQAVLYSSILRAQHSSGFPFQSGRVPHPRGLCEGGGFDFPTYWNLLPESIRKKRKEGMPNAKAKRPAPN